MAIPTGEAVSLPTLSRRSSCVSGSLPNDLPGIFWPYPFAPGNVRAPERLRGRQSGHPNFDLAFDRWTSSHHCRLGLDLIVDQNAGWWETITISLLSVPQQRVE
jgi:hypothetical protein